MRPFTFLSVVQILHLRFHCVAQQFMTEEEEEDADEDEDFMFQGPSGTSQAFHDHSGGGGTNGFNANFDFMHTQNVSGSNTFAAFDGADTGLGVVTAFADFASFEDGTAAASFSPNSAAQPGTGFEDFADFSDFESTSVDSSNVNSTSVDAPDSVIDFAPSEF